MAALAEENHVIILWPGDSEVDYGGDFALREIDEAIEAAKTILGRSKVVTLVQGTCSSGVTALRYAESHSVQGLILQSPVVNRYQSRWVRGLEMDDPQYPPSVLAAEQLDPSLNTLAGIPVYLVYNSGMPGHGDPIGSRLLCERLRGLGSEVEAHWPKPDKEWLWGERERALLRPALAWASAHGRSGGQGQGTGATANQTAIPQYETIKSTLLCGFRLAEFVDPKLAPWFEWWQSNIPAYRGSKLEAAKQQWQREFRVTVSGRILNEKDINLIEGRTFFRGKSRLGMRGSLLTLSKEDELWGFRLVADGPRRFVEVFRSENGSHPAPRIDPLIDGSCSGGLWRWSSGRWQLADCWR